MFLNVYILLYIFNIGTEILYTVYLIFSAIKY